MSGNAVLFHALIVPHRSLSRRGLYWLMALIVGSVALTGLRFIIVRAWPVVGFSVVESTLAVALLAINFRRGRASELVILTEREVRITRTDASGRRSEKHISHAWLNVLVQERPGAVCRLVLATHGVEEEIGSVLGEEQKRDLAKALRDALWQMRNPVFDNPQLRDTS